MAEQSWTDESQAAPRKKGIPGWVWFCGSGCLLALVAAAVLAVFGVRAVREGMDPEQQWERLAEVLPYDPQPAHLRIGTGLQLGIDFYTLQDDRGYTLAIQNLGPAEKSELGRIFGPEFDGSGGIFAFAAIQDAELGEVEVQGRTLRIQRFHQSGGSLGHVQIAPGHSAFIDATPSGSDGSVLSFVVRTGPGDQPLTDEEIRDVLAPFHIGPERPAPALPEKPAEEGGGAGEAKQEGDK